MFKSLLKENGELRYLQVIIYSILVGLFIMAYVQIISLSFLIAFVNIGKVVSVFLYVYVMILVTTGTIEFIAFIHQLVEPIRIQIIQMRPIILITEIIEAMIQEYRFISNSHKEICVFRC